MIGSPERVKIQRSSILKIRNIHVCVWKLEVKNSQNSQFRPKMAKISPNQNFPGKEYDFPKEDHKNNFHTKN